MAKTVLIVDDSESIREVVNFTLQNEGYDVLVGVDGEDALKFLDGRNIDIVITDLHMPNLDGLGLIRKVREMEAYKHIPILFLTTESQTEKKMEAKEAENIYEVLTFKELVTLFKEKNIPEEITDPKYCVTFDKFYNDYTKIYPNSGGLSSTLNYRHLFKKREVLVKEGLNNLMKIFDNFKDGKYKHYKFLDVLNCDGGCINGPGMIGATSVRERRRRVINYRNFAWKYEKDLGRTGIKTDAEDIDFTREM